MAKPRSQITSNPVKSFPVEEEVEVASLQPKFVDGIKVMSSAMIERETEVKLLVASMLVDEHCLFVGPPGFGKSHVTDNFRMWMQIPEEDYFDYLFAKYTTPEEIFGPMDIDGLVSRKEVQRITEGFLPHAKLAFIDEFFKASPAIINTLLKIMNERIFKFGRQRFKSALRCLLASSNEFGQDVNELAACFDRFLFRYVVQDLSEEGDRQLYKHGYDNFDCRPTFTSHVNFEEVDQAQTEFMNMPWSVTAKQQLWTIMEELKQGGVHPSPRRKIKIFKSVRAWAWLEGRSEVVPEDLEVLQYVLWVHPDQIKETARIVDKYACPLKVQLNEIYLQAKDAKVKLMVNPHELDKAMEELERKLVPLEKTAYHKKVKDYVSSVREEAQMHAFRLRSKKSS